MFSSLFLAYWWLDRFLTAVGPYCRKFVILRREQSAPDLAEGPPLKRPAMKASPAEDAPISLSTDALGKQHERCFQIHFFFLEKFELKVCFDQDPG